MKDKIKLLFIPYILILLGLVVGYTFLHWFLMIELQLFHLKELVICAWVPIFLTGVVGFLIFRLRIKVLNLSDKWKNFYSGFVWLSLLLPLSIAQFYIETATGKLTELDSIGDINKTKATKYYTVKSYYFDKYNYNVTAEFDVSGKHNENLNIHIYYVVPVIKKFDDTLNANIPAWLGIKYYETISNRLEDNEKDERYNKFWDECFNHFMEHNLDSFNYLERVPYSDDRDGYLEAIQKHDFYSTNENILTLVNEPFEARNGNKLIWILITTIIILVIWLIMIIIPKFDPTQLERVKNGQPDKEAQENLKGFLDLFLPKKNYLITPIIVLINVSVFLLMVLLGLGFIDFHGEDLLRWGANYGPMTKQGDLWRLLTCTFLHGGIMHLLLNMYGLIYVGIMLEPILGKVKFASVYLLTGIIASIASIWWYDATVSVGASGAIFGIYGVFFAFMLTKVFPKEFSSMFLISTAVFIGGSLLMGLMGGIDNAAHIGGLVSGFIFGIILTPSAKKRMIELDKEFADEIDDELNEEPI